MTKLAKRKPGPPLAPVTTTLIQQRAATIKSNCLQLESEKRRALLPIQAKGFGIDTLNCAIKLTGTHCPTASQLDAALLEMYPVGGPTAASLLLAGWLLPTIDNKGLRIRELPTSIQII